MFFINLFLLPHSLKTLKYKPFVLCGAHNLLDRPSRVLQLPHAHSKQLFMGHLFETCAKTSDIVLIKTMTSTPGVEIKIAFLICNCSRC